MSAVPAARTVNIGRIARTGLIAAAIAAAINVVVGLVARAFIDVPDTFLPLMPGPIIVVTVLAVLAGTAVYALLVRFTDRPNRIFPIVAWTVAILTVAQPFAALNADLPQFEGGTVAAATVLGVLHLIPAAVIVPLLTRSGGQEPAA